MEWKGRLEHMRF